MLMLHAREDHFGQVAREDRILPFRMFYKSLAGPVTHTASIRPQGFMLTDYALPSRLGQIAQDVRLLPGQVTPHTAVCLFITV
jgi:hypothetical protein